MRCPVCGASIPLLAERCDTCWSEWREGQNHCPAELEIWEELVKCSLSFRHVEHRNNNTKKHRATVNYDRGVPPVGPKKVTFIWEY